MTYLKILKNSKLYIIFFITFFILFYLFNFWGCISYKNRIYYTIFYLDKNYGYLIPVSFKIDNNLTNEVINNIVYQVLKIKVDSIKMVVDKDNKSNNFNIFISQKPAFIYDYDTILAYDQLYFSFFYSQIYGKINFYFNSNKLILNGIDFSFNIDEINTKIFNNIFNLKRIDEGNYFLFSSYDKNNVIPIFLPKNYELSITLSNQFNDKGLYSIKDFLLTKFNVKELYVQDNNTFVIYFRQNITKKETDMKKFYFLFFNTNLEKIVFKDKNKVLIRPKNFSFTSYAINSF
jgi:hypothetical protein